MSKPSPRGLCIIKIRPRLKPKTWTRKSFGQRLMLTLYGRAVLCARWLLRGKRNSPSLFATRSTRSSSVAVSASRISETIAAMGTGFHVFLSCHQAPLSIAALHGPRQVPWHDWLRGLSADAQKKPSLGIELFGGERHQQDRYRNLSTDETSHALGESQSRHVRQPRVEKYERKPVPLVSCSRQSRQRFGTVRHHSHRNSLPVRVIASRAAFLRLVHQGSPLTVAQT